VVYRRKALDRKAHGIGPTLTNLVKGRYLTRQESIASYAVIRHNIRTYLSAGVVEVVQGRQKAESEVKKLENSQHSGDRHEGWRYFLEKTDLKVGTDPIQATRQRQAALEKRELKALWETKTPIVHLLQRPR